jgi:ketosteroid isomerase-like protein
MEQWQEWVRDTYAAVDTKDTEGYLRQLTADVRWRFGNGPELVGHEAVRGALIPFFAGLHGLSHHMSGQWRAGDAVILESEVTYTRRDGTTVTLPAATIYRMRGHLAYQGQIFMDIAPAFTGGASDETPAHAESGATALP